MGSPGDLGELYVLTKALASRLRIDICFLFRQTCFSQCCTLELEEEVNHTVWEACYASKRHE